MPDLKAIGTYCNNKILTQSEQVHELVSPVSGEVLTEVHLSTRDEVAQAIAATDEAFLSWRESPPDQRARVLDKTGALLRQKKEEFARTMTLEMGKTLEDARAEVEYAAGYFNWFAKEAMTSLDEEIPSQKPNKRLSLFFEPVGPCAMITPWNFPLALPGRKIAGALAAGCTAIVKPTKECPLSLILLAEAAREAGLPEGCLNVVFGPGKEIGPQLMEAKSIRKLSFTGSTEVGKHLYEQAAATVKKLTLELGGHAPLIVFDDADLELAVKQTLVAKLRNSGQTCIAPNRLFIQKGIYADFVERLKDEAGKLRYGNPLDDETDLTTVLHPTSVEKVQDHIADALEKGARAVLKPEHAYGVAILEDVNPSMKLFTEETFGPVFPMIPFETEEEAVMRANESDYGLAAYLFTSSMERGYRVARGLEYGIIGFNDGGPSAPEASFGGVKYSGFGREGGPNGIREYLTEKCVSLLD